MFTGIVEELGEVVALERSADAARISVRGRAVTADATRGASIAVNGICLTVVDLLGDEHGPHTFTADVMAETLARTSLADLVPGSRVNLERPVPAGGRLGGHVVQGHVDGVGTVLERIPGERWEVVRIGVPASLARYLAEKGSVAVDGVSLTVVEVRDTADAVAHEGITTSFTVSLIPETLERTTLGIRGPGERVNLEVDVLAKYTERLLAVTNATNATTATTGSVLR